MTWLKDRAKCRGHRASGDLDVAATHLGEFPQCSCVGVRIEGTEFVGNPAIRPPAGGTPGQVLRVAHQHPRQPRVAGGERVVLPDEDDRGAQRDRQPVVARQPLESFPAAAQRIAAGILVESGLRRCPAGLE